MIKRIFTVVLVLLTFMVISCVVFFYQAKTMKGSFIGERFFHVDSGEDIRSVAERLQSDRLTVSKWFFLWSAWRDGLIGKLHSGDYVIGGGLTAPEAVHIFLSEEGKSQEINITFPEGWTMEKMAARLSTNGFDGDEFLKLAKVPLSAWRTTYHALADLPPETSLEGFLFPDTYTFRLTATPQDILEKMLENFDRRFEDAGLFTEAQKQEKSIFTTVTMASILEREIGSASQSATAIERDRKLVSDLFWRRIADDHPLQSDATLEYTLGESKVQHSIEETKTDSPYNSYVYKGLPPGPISNPGIVSLRAALFSTPNQYYFFLNNPKTGETFYAITFEEHKQNKVKNGL